MANIFSTVGHFLGDQVRKAQYGPDYKQRVRYLQQLADREEEQYQQESRARTTTDKQRILARALAARPVLADSAFDAAQQTPIDAGAPTPELAPMGGQPFTAPGGDPAEGPPLPEAQGSSGGYATNLPPAVIPGKRETTFQPFDTSIVSEDPELAAMAPSLIAGAKGKVKKDIEVQQQKDRTLGQGDRRLAQGDTRLDQSGRNVDSQIASRNAQTADMQMTAKARLDRLLRPAGVGGGGGRSPNDDPRNYVLSTDSATGEAVRIRKTDGATFPLEGIRRSDITVGEREKKVSIESILDDIDQIGSTVSRNPGAVGMLSKLENWVGQYTGGVDPDIVEVHTQIYEGLVQKLHDISGAAVTPSEATRLMKTIPDPGLQTQVFQQRLKLWKEDLEQASRAYRLGRGPNTISRTPAPATNPLVKKPTTPTSGGLDPTVLDRLKNY